MSERPAPFRGAGRSCVSSAVTEGMAFFPGLLWLFGGSRSPRFQTSTAARRHASLARMSRPHDVGGRAGFGPLVREVNEPPFHHEWEARVFALNRRLLQLGIYNLDEFRFAVERMGDEAYVASTYYEKWLVAVERLLAEKGVLP